MPAPIDQTAARLEVAKAAAQVAASFASHGSGSAETFAKVAAAVYDSLIVRVLPVEVGK